MAEAENTKNNNKEFNKDKLEVNTKAQLIEYIEELQNKINDTENFSGGEPNPSKIKWGVDKYGCVSDLRKAITEAASRCSKFHDKMDVLIDTMDTGYAHIMAKHDEAFKHA